MPDIIIVDDNDSSAELINDDEIIGSSLATDNPYEVDPAQCELPEPLAEPETTENATVVENQASASTDVTQLYVDSLKQLFPSTDQEYLSYCCQGCDNDDVFYQIVNSLLDAGQVKVDDNDSSAETGHDDEIFCSWLSTDNSCEGDPALQLQCELPEPLVEPEATENATIVENQASASTNANQLYVNKLKQMFPSVDQAYLSHCCQDCDNDDEFHQIVNSLLDASNLPQEPIPLPAAEMDHPFFDDEDALQPHPYMTLVEEVFPNMSLMDLENHCNSLSADVSLPTIVTALNMQEVSNEQNPLELMIGEETPSNSQASCSSAEDVMSERRHPLFMDLVEMFPDIPLDVLERHLEGFEKKATLETIAESVLQLNLPTPTAEATVHSERLRQLMEIFPHMELAVLERRCEDVDPDEPFDLLVGLIMEEAEEAELVIQEMNEQEGAAALPPEENLEQLAAYQSLLNILPNADPDFLREKFESFLGNEDALKIFIAEALENQNYPTYEKYNKRVHKMRVQRKYREEFSPKSFLNVVPDPFQHFGNKTYKDTKPLLELEKAFLMSRYRNIDDEIINQVYKLEQYNLYNTCTRLDLYEGPLVAERDSNPFLDCYHNIDNEQLLQEIALIINEGRIRHYIKENDAAKVKALEQARKKNELLTCGCCYDESVLLVDMAACEDGHLFCKDCVRKSAEVLIGDGKLFFPCLMECGKKFNLQTLKVVLQPSVFFRMSQRQQLEEVQAANIVDLETCPFCDFGAIPMPEDKVFTCLNTDCMQLSCRFCKEPNHLPLHCDELPERDEQVKARVHIEDRMTQALVRECYKCKKKFVKSDGCNKMVCSCGAIMCYLCRQPVKDYSHFNGQGGDAYDKCPLWTTNDEVHVRAVEEAAALAKQEVVNASQNPEFALKYDPTHVLP